MTIIITMMIIMTTLLHSANAQAFQSAWSSASVEITCGDNIATLQSKGALNLTLITSDTVYFFGHVIINNNFNPAVIRFDGGMRSWCRTDYDESSDDGAAYGGLIDLNTNSLYVAFSSNGNSPNGMGEYTKSGWIIESGQPNGHQFSIILEINADTGSPTGLGTYIFPIYQGLANYARLIKWEKTKVDSITITLRSGPFPLDRDAIPLTCDYFYHSEFYTWTLELTLDLTTAISSSSTSCENSGSISSNSNSQSTFTSPKSTIPIRSGIFDSVDGTLSRDITPGSSSASSLSLCFFLFAFVVALMVA